MAWCPKLGHISLYIKFGLIFQLIFYKMEKHVFRIYDMNHDGYIDFIEFMVVFHVLSGMGRRKNTFYWTISAKTWGRGGG